MHVDSKTQEFGIETQNKSQTYIDLPRTFQLYVAYMKNNPSKEKIPDVEMADESKNENNSLIVNSTAQHANVENIVSHNVSKDTDMDPEINFEKLDSQILPNACVNHQASNNSQDLKNTHNVEPILLSKPQLMIETNANEDRKS